MPTQAELDKAVLDAADHLYDQTSGWTTGELQLAVRARRAAMRPHKAALLMQFRRSDSMNGKIMFSDQALAAWDRMSPDDKRLRRMVLAEILAAPDEEQP